ACRTTGSVQAKIVMLSWLVSLSNHRVCTSKNRHPELVGELVEPQHLYKFKSPPARIAKKNKYFA
ncbi:MAG: hypothetical protein II077_14910, partial [Treponema sp.]|nr:hypothetical protein [Treponema sp.]